MPDGEDASADDGAALEDEGVACLGGSPPTLTMISVEDLHAALEEKDFLLINVAGAPSIPKTDAIIGYSDTDALVAFIGPEKSVRVVLYCQSGGRSGVAGAALVSLGYCSIQYLSGGKTAWVQAGYPLE